MSKVWIDDFKLSEIGVWAVVVNNRVVANHIGHPETYANPWAEEFNISLVQHSNERGRPKIGSTWTGDRFING